MQSAPSVHPSVCFHSILDLDQGQFFLVFIVVGHTTKQMAHGCSYYIQLCCPLFEMSHSAFGLVLTFQPWDNISECHTHKHAPSVCCTPEISYQYWKSIKLLPSSVCYTVCCERCDSENCRNSWCWEGTWAAVLYWGPGGGWWTNDTGIMLLVVFTRFLPMQHHASIVLAVTRCLYVCQNDWMDSAGFLAWKISSTYLTLF